MKTSTLFAALCTAAAALCAMSAEAQTAPAAPQAAAAPAPGTPWSLDDCIGYALANNIDVQQRALQVEQNEVELSTAKYSRLPDLNASIGGDASFGRVLSSDNTYKDNNQTSGSLNISTSLPVFQGMRINRQVKGGKLDLAAAMQDLERAREDVSINVMTLYLEVLYNKELTDVAERQLALSTLQATQSRELVAAGKQPESARYESEALMAKDQLSLTQARNDLQLALLNLSQALNRESAAGFDVVVPELDSVTLASLHRLGTADGVYNYAVENRPHIKAERLRLESSENSVLIAKSALYPSISLSGGYGTGVYSADSDKFWAQMRHNSLALTEAELALRKEIEQAWYNADAAYSKYRSAGVALASAEVAFAYEQQKAESGRSTIFDFNDAKTRMEKAESELVQAKYEFVFRSKILDFYRGKPLKL